MLYPGNITWQCDHLCLHAWRVPMLPCGSLGLFICTPAMSQDCHMTALIHIFTCAVYQHHFGWQGLAWSLTSHVPAQTCDGRGSSLYMPAIFQQCHVVLWTCLFETVPSNCLQVCYVPVPIVWYCRHHSAMSLRMHLFTPAMSHIQT